MSAIEEYRGSVAAPRFNFSPSKTNLSKQNNKQGDKQGNKKKNPYAAPRSQNLRNSKKRRIEEKDGFNVTRFKDRVKQKAYDRFEQNSVRAEQIRKDHVEGANSVTKLEQLRNVVRQDGELEAEQRRLRTYLRVYTDNEEIADASLGEKSYDPQKVAEYNARLEQIEIQRNNLLALNPASQLIKTKEADLSDAELKEVLNQRFAVVQQDIDTAQEKVLNDDVPIQHLEPIINEVLAEHKNAEVPPEKIKEIDDYLQKRRNNERNTQIALQVGGGAATIATLLAAPLGAPVGLVKSLGVVGAALEGGSAYYNLEKAQDLNSLAKAGEGAIGGEDVIFDSEQAKTNYYLAIGNLVLAGVDVFAVGADGVKVTKKLLSNRTSNVVANLTQSQKARFKTLINSTDEAQKQRIRQSLRQELGDDFDTAHSVFVHAKQQVGGKTAEYSFFEWEQEIETSDLPELKALREKISNNPSGGDEFLKAELEDIRLNLLSNTEDLGNIYDVMRRSGFKVSRKDIAAVKQYNFNSPGISFNPDNYGSWVKLARGKGSIRDAHYLMHEIEEIKQLRKIQQETGFDFMGKD